MSSKKFATPNLRVYLSGSPEPLDVQTTQADAVRFDLVRARLSWPKTSDAPMLWATFLAWHALRREVKAGSRPAVPGLPDKPEESLDAFDVVSFLDEHGNELSDDDADELGVSPTHGTA